MSPEQSQSLDIRGYLRPLRKRWWIVVVVAAAAATFAYAYADRKPFTYIATTSLLLRDEGAGPTVSERANREQAVLLRTRVIARAVAKDIGFKGNPAALLRSISARASEGTGFLNLTVTTSNPRTAVLLVNAFAKAYIDHRSEEVKRSAKLAREAAERRLANLPETFANAPDRSQLLANIQILRAQEKKPEGSVQQIEPAIGAGAIGPKPRKNAIFAVVLGGLLGLVVVYGLESLDRRLRRLEEVSETYDSPVLVCVPSAPSAATASRVGLRLEPPLTEAFRTLRTTLQLHATDAADPQREPLRTLLVTSAVPGEGKSTVARSLALAYIEAGLRVALVDADLRRPSLAAILGVDAAPGLTDLLLSSNGSVPALRPVQLAASAAGPAPSKGPAMAAVSVGQQRTVGAMGATTTAVGPTFTAVTSGLVVHDPAALLATGPLEAVLDAITAKHDIVIIDSSPLLAVSDAVPLLRAVDGVLIVSRLGITTRQAVKRLRELLSRVPDAEVLGVVANDVNLDAAYGYGGYDAGYA